MCSLKSVRVVMCKALYVRQNSSFSSGNYTAQTFMKTSQKTQFNTQKNVVVYLSSPWCSTNDITHSRF